MQPLKMPEIRSGQATAPVVIGIPMTFVEMRDLRTTARSLPEWVAWRARWSGSKIDSNDGTTVAVLPEAVPALTTVERALVQKKIADVAGVVAVETWPVVVDNDEHGRQIAVTAEQAKLVLVTKMLMAKASANMTAEGAAAKGESYLIALSDIPAWAVEAAIADWYRGKVSWIERRDDFKWSPDSSVLRRVAEDRMKHYVDLLADLERVRDARPLSEITG